MGNRRLNPQELAGLFKPLIEEVRAKLETLASGDPELHWALRRKLAKELVYDERSGPSARRKLKALKRQEQKNRCAVCSGELPEKYVTLDRLEAMRGYTAENTRLICEACDRKIQIDRGYA
jgi:ribosomal protein L44E